MSRNPGYLALLHLMLIIVQTSDFRSSSRRHRLRAMGSKSGSGRRAAPNTCTDWKRWKDVGRHGYAKSAEGEASKLQNTAGAEGGKRIAQKRYGQEYVLSTHPLPSFKLTDMKVNKKGLVKELFGDQA